MNNPMNAIVKRFVESADEGLVRVLRMSTLDPPEMASISCAKRIDFGPFLRSIKMDPKDIDKTDAPIQSDILTEATEAMERIQASVAIGYDELLDVPELSDKSARLLEDIMDCLEDLTDALLPAIIETRRTERQDKNRPAYGIIAHGELCSAETFVVPRGCTIVFLAPPGGFTFIGWTSRKMMDQRLIDDVRADKGHKKLYMVYYHEGSVVRDQYFGTHDAKKECDWIYTGVVRLPLPRKRSEEAVKNHIVERIHGDDTSLSQFVRADRPGIYVVNSCRVTTDDKVWENTVKRNARALRQDTDECKRLLKCKDRHACKRLSYDSHFGFWWQLHPRAWKSIYDPNM
jgi:hypothetical protein